MSIYVFGECGGLCLSEPYVVQLNMCVVEYMFGKLGCGGAGVRLVRDRYVNVV